MCPVKAVMISRKTILCGIALCSLFRAEAASAQPRWGRERLPKIGACFYERLNFDGRYFCVKPGERLSSLPSDMDDEISSLRVVGSAEVIIFSDKNMRGRSARFTADERNLRREGWNDQISSLEVRRLENPGRGDDRARVERVPVWGREGVPLAGACFYRDADFRGPYFCLARGETHPALPRGFRDSISSIRLFGSGVRIYTDRDFHGRSSEIRSDVRNLRGSWRDTVSSIRV